MWRKQLEKEEEGVKWSSLLPVADIVTKTSEEGKGKEGTAIGRHRRERELVSINFRE